MASVLSCRTGNLSFIDLIDRYVPVQSSLLRQLEIRDIIALSRTCKKLSHVYGTTIRTQYNINDALKPYFKSPLEFRKVQAKTDAILCEEAALCFFLREPLTGVTGRLIIFARKGSSLKTMRAFLLDDGWIEENPADVHENIDAHTYHLHKPFEYCQKPSKNPTLNWPKLTLVATATFPLFIALVNSLFTDCLNLITWSHAYSLLPYPTFILKRSYFLQHACQTWSDERVALLRMRKEVLNLEVEPYDLRDTQNDIAREYVAAHDSQATRKRLPSKVDYHSRRFGDKYSWTIPLNTEGIEREPRSEVSITHSSFRILPIYNPPPARDQHGNEQYTPSYYHILALAIRAPCLRYEYIVDGTKTSDPAYVIDGKRYEDLSFAQIEALADEEKPHGWTPTGMQAQDLIHSCEETFGGVVPASWRYYDDEVEGILRARWDELSVPNKGKDVD